MRNGPWPGWGDGRSERRRRREEGGEAGLEAADEVDGTTALAAGTQQRVQVETNHNRNTQHVNIRKNELNKQVLTELAKVSDGSGGGKREHAGRLS